MQKHAELFTEELSEVQMSLSIDLSRRGIAEILKLFQKSAWF